MANFTKLTVNGTLTVRNGNILETAGTAATSTYVHNIYIYGTHSSDTFFCSLSLLSTASTACTSLAQLCSTFGGHFYPVISGIISGTKSTSAPSTPTCIYFTDLGIGTSDLTSVTHCINAYSTSSNSAIALDQGWSPYTVLNASVVSLSVSTIQDFVYKIQ